MAETEAGLTVAQMSAATGLSAHTLRYYERAELIRSVARTAGNQRRYSAADVTWLAFLLRLRETGMPIAQMREYAALRAQGVMTSQRRRGLSKNTGRRCRRGSLVRTHGRLSPKIVIDGATSRRWIIEKDVLVTHRSGSVGSSRHGR